MPSPYDSASSDHMGLPRRQHPNATLPPVTRRSHHIRSGPDPPVQVETTTGVTPFHPYTTVEPPLSATQDGPFIRHASTLIQQIDQPNRDRVHTPHASDFPPFGRAHAPGASVQAYSGSNYGNEQNDLWSSPVPYGFQPTHPQTSNHHNPGIPVPGERYAQGSLNPYDNTSRPSAWPSQHPGDDYLDSPTSYRDQHRPSGHQERTYNIQSTSSTPSPPHRQHAIQPSGTPHPPIPSTSSSLPVQQSQHSSMEVESDVERDVERDVYRCSMCPTTCSRKTDLLRHMRDRHSPVPHKEVCPYCGIEVGRMDALKRHIRVTCKQNPARRMAEVADQDAAGKKGKGKERKKNDE